MFDVFILCLAAFAYDSYRQDRQQANPNSKIVITGDSQSVLITP